MHTEGMEVSTREQLINQIRVKFNLQFGKEPDNITLAPGRINIIGEHTDYNDGLAMPVAIDRWICAAVCRSNSESSTIYSLNYNESAVITPHALGKFQAIWKQLASASIHVLITEFSIEEGANMTVGGNIPIGCGLSSSSAFIISITQAFCQLFSIPMEDLQLAHICQKIENRALGTAGGLLDQYGIILSKKDHFMMIDFQDNSIEYLPLSLNGCSWLVVNSGINRELSESEYIYRVKECRDGLEILKNRFNITGFRDIDKNMLPELESEHKVSHKRLRHLLDENNRVKEMKVQLKKGNKKRIGKILQESHESLRSLYQASCKEIDYIVQLSESFDGWYGGRIIWGGFGGCSLHLIADNMIEKYRKYISKSFGKKHGIKLDIIDVQFSGGLSCTNDKCEYSGTAK